MNEHDNTNSRRMRIFRVVFGNLLLLVIAAVAIWLIRRPRVQAPAPAVTPGSTGPGMTVEAAERETQAWVSERMKDPAYREALKTLVERRRALAVEANALASEVGAWQQARAQSDADFAALIRKWANASRRGAGVTNDWNVVEALNREIREQMARAPGGRELLDRQDDLQSRMDDVSREAGRTVAMRIQMQAAKAFSSSEGTAAPGRTN